MKSSALVAALLLVCAVPFAPAQKKPVKKPAPKKQAPKKVADKPTIEVLLSEAATNAGGSPKLVALKAGDKLTGERTFRIRVSATDPVSSVEFYVGDDLRDTDGSTPYEFKFDALNEEEGPVKLTFKGYTTRGTSATKVLNLTIDNGGGVPIETHLTRAREALSESRFDAAIDSARIALKVDPASNPARLLLSRAYLGKGEFDRAQKFAEDALAADANLIEAREILGSVGVRRAFRTSSAPNADRAEAIKSFGDSLGGAAESRAKVDEARFDALPADAAAKNPAGYADIAFEAGRYTTAIDAIRPLYQADTTRTDLGNRLTYAYLMASDPKAARDTLASIARFGKFDAYTYALQGLLFAEAGDNKAAEEAFKNGALENADSLGLRTAQASVLLKRNRPADRPLLTALATSLGRSESSRPEVNFYLAAVANRLQDYGVSRKNFEAAVRIDPANSDMYIEQGSQALALAFNTKIEAKEKSYLLDSAKSMFEVALKARPNSPYAFSGLAIVAMEQNRAADAVRNAELAVRAADNAAIGHFVLAGALAAQRAELVRRSSTLPAGEERDAARVREGELSAALSVAMRRSAELDRPNLEGRVVPDGQAAYRYLSSAGRAPVLTPPSQG